MPGSSLLDVGQLSRPVTVLVERSSDAVGGLFKPWQIRRVAKAEAEAATIRAESEIQITEAHQKAFRRFIEEEANNQANMESIIMKAIPHVDDEKSAPEDIENDWFTNFFDKCRIVSDDNMQELWARILAGEANNPGSFSRKTVNLAADLDKRHAELFTCLCGFVWTIGDRLHPLIFDTQDEIYGRYGINFGSLGDLEALGLIHFNVSGRFHLLHLPKRCPFFYGNRRVELTMPNDSENKLITGKVLLTLPGKELARISGAVMVEGFFEYVYDRWAGESLVPPREPASNG